MSNLEIYFREDVVDRLGGIEATIQHLEPGPFRSGFVAGLQAVRRSFGLESATDFMLPETKYLDVIVTERTNEPLPPELTIVLREHVFRLE